MCITLTPWRGCWHRVWTARRGKTEVDLGFTRISLQARRLEGMAARLTPAGGEDVATVVAGPVVEGSFPPVESDVDQVVVERPNCGAADEMWIFLVDSLQLLTNCKPVHLWCRRFFLK